MLRLSGRQLDCFGTGAGEGGGGKSVNTTYNFTVDHNG